MALSRLSILKLAELIITLTCLGLHYNSMSEVTDQHSILLINGTFVGFSIILVGIFAGFIVNTPINKRIDLFYSAVGCVLFIICGVIILQFWNDSSSGKLIGFVSNDRKSLGITKGSLAVINGIVFAIDAFFTCKD